MTVENIKTLLYQTQNLMYGFNYEATLGIEVFGNCFSILDTNNAIKNKFPNSNPGAINAVAVLAEEFWKEITAAFDYRGDILGVSLQLNEKQERELKSKQQKIKDFVAQYIKEDTKIYSYSFIEGVPGYPVFWEYSFAILNSDGTCIFFYGSSSD